MRVTIKNPTNADTFAAMFQHIKAFTEHIVVQFNSERMYIQTMDPSKVSILEIVLPKSWFDEYEINASIQLGVHSNYFYKILNTREPSQDLILTFDQDQDYLCIEFASEQKAVFNRRFELPLIDVDVELMEIPDTDSHADFSMSSSNFANIINQLKIFGDTVDIHCNEDLLTLTSTSQENGKMKVDIGFDDLAEFAIQENMELSLSFSLTFLHNICLYNKLAKTMDFQLTSEFPLKTIYKLGDGGAHMTFYLAPKINDDDF
jgi:proliferating cell nuclear antigen